LAVRVVRARGSIGGESKPERACKPGSVESDHFSGTTVARRLGAAYPDGIPEGTGRTTLHPAWPCSRWGLPCRACRQAPRCALTAPFHPCLILRREAIGGLFSVALSRSSRTVGVAHHRVLWSPDFPPRGARAPCSGRSARSGKVIVTALLRSSGEFAHRIRRPVASRATTRLPTDRAVETAGDVAGPTGWRTANGEHWTNSKLLEGPPPRRLQTRRPQAAAIRGDRHETDQIETRCSPIAPAGRRKISPSRLTATPWATIKVDSCETRAAGRRGCLRTGGTNRRACSARVQFHAGPVPRRRRHRSPAALAGDRQGEWTGLDRRGCRAAILRDLRRPHGKSAVIFRCPAAPARPD